MQNGHPICARSCSVRQDQIHSRLPPFVAKLTLLKATRKPQNDEAIQATNPMSDIHQHGSECLMINVSVGKANSEANFAWHFIL